MGMANDMMLAESSATDDGDERCCCCCCWLDDAVWEEAVMGPDCDEEAPWGLRAFEANSRVLPNLSDSCWIVIFFLICLEASAACKISNYVVLKV